MERRMISTLTTMIILSQPVMANRDLAIKSGCMACHQVDKKVVGPAYQEVATRYKGQSDAVQLLSAKIRAGGKDAWGQIPMPPNPNVSDADASTLAKWVLSGAR
ncbi:MAG: c-type cytochrome [Rhodocyclaceae bacterium]|nr:c-type cytochrome [Rhodocyclaceae bacterium]